MTTWINAPLVALDLEGSGAQDRDDEAILEIAIVPIRDGRPSLAESFTSLVNPGRPIPRRPWISPGLTSKVLASAPLMSQIESELVKRINGTILVGHNIGVDYRLLRRRCPDIEPQALIDTLRLIRHLNPGVKGNALGALLDRYNLTTEVSTLAPGSQPHRALWDTAGTALLFPALIRELPSGDAITISELLQVAGLATATTAGFLAEPSAAGQGSLFDP